MRVEKASIIYVSKILRSFYNGVFSCFIVYYFILWIDYRDPLKISLVIFGSLLSNVVKARLIRYLMKEKEMVYIGMLFTFALHLVPFVVISSVFLFQLYFPMPPIIMTLVAFFPVDGEQVQIFQQVELDHIFRISSRITMLQKRKRAYNILGYSFQALGSLAFFLFIIYRLKEANYDEYQKIQQIYIFLSFFAFLNIVFYTIVQFFVIKKSASEKRKQQNIPFNRQSFHQINKYSYFLNGLALGLIPAPFLAYFLDIKISLYYDDIGIMICAFFLLKGLGKDLMQRLWKFKRFFTLWHLVSNIFLVIITIFPYRTLTIFCLILCFPVLNYCGAILQQRLDDLDVNRKQKREIQERLSYQERLGAAFGCLIASFSFCLFYKKLYFGYAFALCAVARYFCNRLIQRNQGPATAVEDNMTSVSVLPKSEKNDEIEMQIFEEKVSKDEHEERQKQIQEQLSSGGEHSNSQEVLKQRIKQISLWMVLLFTLIFSINLFSTTCIYQGTCHHKSYKSDPVDTPSSLKLFNESIAHYLVRKGITEVKLLNCDQDCLTEYEGKGRYYSQLNLRSSNPKWLHFAETPYFVSQRQIEAALGPALLQHPGIAGFSLMWDDPLRYNKITKEVLQLIIEFAGEQGLNYAEMPSLNLRMQQYKALSIFTRQKRRPVQLPRFVKRQPSKNYLATVVIYKMGTNLRYLREYLLYYLNVGVDKFFLFNNDREFGSANFYSEFRDVGEYFRQCQSISSLDEQFAFFNQIWEQFYDHIVYIPWRIGEQYPQVDGYFSYRLFFQTVTKFSFYNDLDEFVHSPSSMYLPQTLEDLLEKDDVTVLYLVSRNFMSRVCLGKQLAIEQYEWLKQKQQQLTIKCITLNSIQMSISIHGRWGKNGKVAYLGDTRHDFGIWHYKITSTYEELELSTQQYFYDDSLKVYIEGLKEACNGKCADSIDLTCSEQVHKKMMEKFCSH